MNYCNLQHGKLGSLIKSSHLVANASCSRIALDHGGLE